MPHRPPTRETPSIARRRPGGQGRSGRRPSARGRPPTAEVGAANTEGIFSTGDWFPGAKTAGNADFIKAWIAKYGGTAAKVDPAAAEALHAASCSSWSPSGMARSTTQPLSRPFTTAPGLPWKAISAGTLTALRRAPTSSCSGSAVSCSRCTRRPRPSPIRSPSRPGRVEPCICSCRPPSWESCSAAFTR